MDDDSCEIIYEWGKSGNWEAVRNAFDANPQLAGKAVRYVHPRSGWSLLHQASYWGCIPAVALCLKFGADSQLASNNSQTPSQVALERGHTELSILLNDAKVDKFWSPVASDSTLLAASSNWSEASLQVATIDFKVGYAGGEVNIVSGDRFYTDRWGRVLIGWHGTYNPPTGMDGISQLEIL